MKKFKISFIALMAIIIAIGSAFTTRPVTKKTDTYYYQYSLGTTASVMDDTKWFNISNPSVGCSSDDELNCVIHLDVAPDGNGNPDFSSAGITSQTQLNAVTNSWKPVE